MAKESGILNMVLIGGAAYLAWQWWQNQPTTPTVVKNTANAAAKAAADAAALAASNVDAATKAAAAKAAVDAKAASDAAAANNSGGASAKVGKYPYTDKASYQQALVNAVVNAAHGDASTKLTADQWNWYMVNSVGLDFAPDPTNAMAPGQRFTPITAAVYYDALRHQDMLSYPSGLTGLAALTAVINGINRHPLALRAPGNQFYLKPRRVVI